MKRRTLRKNLLPIGVFTLAAVGVGGFSNVLFNIAAASVLQPSAFGGLLAIFTIYSLLTLALSGIESASARAASSSNETDGAAEALHNEANGASRDLWWHIVKVTAVLALGLSPFLFALAYFLKIPSWQMAAVLLVLPAAAGVFCSFGDLVGKGRIVMMQSLSICAALSKLLLTIGAWLLSVSQAFFVLVGLTPLVLQFVASRWITRSDSLKKRQFKGAKVWVNSAILAAFFACQNVDIWLLRLMSALELSGVYGAATSFARALPIIAALWGLYLIPRMARADVQASRALTLKVVIFSIVTSTVLALIAAAVGSLAIQFMFDEGYRGALDLLPWILVATVPWCGAASLIHALMAQTRRAWVLLLVFGAFASQTLCIWLAGPISSRLIVIYGVSGAILLCLLILGQRRTTRSRYLNA